MTLRAAKKLKAGTRLIAGVEKETYISSGYMHDWRNKGEPWYLPAPRVRVGDTVVFSCVSPSVRYGPEGQDEMLVCDLINEYGQKDTVSFWPNQVSIAK